MHHGKQTEEPGSIQVQKQTRNHTIDYEWSDEKRKKQEA
jgi:hypothetical protein